jgi:UDP-N-acetylmuramoyl-tripeptide--D-alanyl-D-alanine ligase
MNSLLPPALPLWTLDAFLAGAGARLEGNAPPIITGISIDTRSLEPGDAFFAIRGEARDGHDFVAAAQVAGAGICVVDEVHAPSLKGSGPLAIVPDVLAAMEKLGQARRAELKARVVAVTGSVGKTGTKEALRLALARQGKTHAPVASYNNHWGVPLTLCRTPADVDYAVYEIGMSHPGEIAPLARMARPHVAIVTTVQAVHLEAFPSVDAIADEKAAIFHGLEPGGVAVINADIPQAGRLRAHAMAGNAGRVVSFGETGGADARLLSCKLLADMSTVEARLFGTDVVYKIGSPGRHIVMNSLAVLAAAKLLGADLALAALALGDLRPPQGRGAKQMLHAPGGQITLVDESYNANPASMRAALDNLGRMKLNARGRRVAVLGDMLELGPTGPDLHRGLAEPLERHGIDLVFLCGPLMRNLWDALPSERRGAYAPNAASLEAHLLDALHADDVVTVKGSLGSRMSPLVKAVIARFPVVEAEG